MLVQDRLTAIIASPDTFQTILAHTANGGSLLDLCAAWDVPYSSVIGWLYDGAEHERAYTNAIRARSEWATERWFKELNSLAYSSERDSIKLKALELIAKRLYLFPAVDPAPPKVETHYHLTLINGAAQPGERVLPERVVI